MVGPANDKYQAKIGLGPLMASAAVHSKAVVQLLFVHCVLLLSLFVVYWVFVKFCSILWPFWFCNHLPGEEQVGCFTFFSFFCSWCHIAVVLLWLFLAVLWVGLWYVIVAIPVHIYLFF